MTREELINKYLNYFKANGHSIISGRSLIPENDPTVLFTTAGMHPLVPYILGQTHPQGNRLVNVQNCIRTGDIDEVGDNTHLTLFQMLGNWSLGDYYKKESIKFSYNFLVNELKFDVKKLAVTVFIGEDSTDGHDNGVSIPKDTTSEGVWRELGIANITFLGKKDNFWGPAGQTGPCGPDTEIFYFIGDEENPTTNPSNDKRWVEIWNNVFMEYVKDANGEYHEAKRKCVDTGMGVERMLCVINKKSNVYDTEAFVSIIQKICEITGKEYNEQNKASMRIVADHIKASCFIIGDDRSTVPSNLGAGYVLRRLIRKAIRILRLLFDKNYKTGSLSQIATSVSKLYPESFTPKKLEEVQIELNKEEAKFLQTLDKGENEFTKMLPTFQKEGIISGENAFKLYETYGFPLELTQDIGKEHNLEVDIKSYNESLEKHKSVSKTEGTFKGGLQDSSYETTRLHTATHLLNKALKMTLGDSVSQKGANITAERLRFDFNFDRKLTDEELLKISDIVNSQIKRNLEITCKEMLLAQAKEMGAIATFESKYEEVVKVYKIGDFSLEVCGGPHVNNTSELGTFEIQKEQSSSAGVRRIKAVLK